MNNIASTLIPGIDDVLVYLYAALVFSILLNILGAGAAIRKFKLMMGKRNGVGLVYFLANSKQVLEYAIKINGTTIKIPGDKDIEYYPDPKKLFLSGSNPAYIFKQGEAYPLNPHDDKITFDAKRIQDIIKTASLTGQLGLLAKMERWIKINLIISLAIGAGTIILLVLIAQKMGVF